MRKMQRLFCLGVMAVGFATALAATPRVVVINEDNDHYFKQDASLMTEEALNAYLTKIRNNIR